VPRRASGGSARLQGIRFLNDERRPAEQFANDELLRVEVTFAIDRSVSAFDIAMAIVHGEGTPVLSEALSDQEAPRAFEPGTYSVEFALDLRYFKLESYFLTLYLLDQGRPLDNVDGIALPEIYNPDADTFMESHRWGVVRIPVRWTQISGRKL
jgi:hypothetical protein